MYPWKGPQTLLNSLDYFEDYFHIIFAGNIKHLMVILRVLINQTLL